MAGSAPLLHGPGRIHSNPDWTNMRKFLFTSALMLALGVAAPRTASADPIELTLQGVSDHTLSANVLLAYNPLLGQLSLNITNTSANYDPRLTSFAFNLPTAISGISSFSSTPTGWSYVLDRNDINTPGQFGFYDAAGLTGPNFNGGSPNLGIPIGSTFSFLFTFTGSNLGNLNESSFVNLRSYQSGRRPERKRAGLHRPVPARWRGRKRQRRCDSDRHSPGAGAGHAALQRHRPAGSRVASSSQDLDQVVAAVGSHAFFTESSRRSAALRIFRRLSVGYTVV